jgi:hypothetical protein
MSWLNKRHTAVNINGLPFDKASPCTAHCALVTQKCDAAPVNYSRGERFCIH